MNSAHIRRTSGGPGRPFPAAASTMYGRGKSCRAPRTRASDRRLFHGLLAATVLSAFACVEDRTLTLAGFSDTRRVDSVGATPGDVTVRRADADAMGSADAISFDMTNTAELPDADNHPADLTEISDGGTDVFGTNVGNDLDADWDSREDQTAPWCGDGLCGAMETPCNCPNDCGEPCIGKECGPDGCGKLCGGDCVASYGYQYSCHEGTCECSLDCATKDCGSDGCGGSCGECADADTCKQGQCIGCETNCEGLQCGANGCGGTCGTCSIGYLCDGDGMCQANCSSLCLGKQCGPTGDEDECFCGDCFDDGNPCTDQTCSNDGMCAFPPNQDPCDDGVVCTVNDTCSNGTCTDFGPLDCDDGNLCTNDECHLVVGCQHSNNTVKCAPAKCEKLFHSPTVLCLNGSCPAQASLDCDDGNGCTTDSCNPMSGCLHLLNTVPCDDGDFCTVGDTCKLGGCVAGEKLDCDDTSPCTDDDCDPNSGCVHKLNTSLCDDGSDCTVGDHCKLGDCVGSSQLDCDDNSLCTTDSCDPEGGCYHSSVSDGAGCPGGNFLCAAGKCVCQPDCSGKECGSDGCGGSCGSCLCTEGCSAGLCQIECTSHKYSACHNGDDYWYDSCGQLQDKKEDCGEDYCPGFNCNAYDQSDCNPDPGFEYCFDGSYGSAQVQMQIDRISDNVLGNIGGKSVVYDAYKVRVKCDGKLYLSADSCDSGGCNGQYIDQNGTFVVTHTEAFAPTIPKKKLTCWKKNGGDSVYTSVAVWWDDLPVVYCFSPLHCDQGQYCDTSGDTATWQCESCP